MADAGGSKRKREPTSDLWKAAALALGGAAAAQIAEAAATAAENICQNKAVLDAMRPIEAAAKKEAVKGLKGPGERREAQNEAVEELQATLEGLAKVVAKSIADKAQAAAEDAAVAAHTKFAELLSGDTQHGVGDIRLAGAAAVVDAVNRAAHTLATNPATAAAHAALANAVAAAVVAAVEEECKRVPTYRGKTFWEVNQLTKLMHLAQSHCTFPARSPDYRSDINWAEAARDPLFFQVHPYSLIEHTVDRSTGEDFFGPMDALVTEKAFKRRERILKEETEKYVSIRQPNLDAVTRLRTLMWSEENMVELRQQGKAAFRL